jgi:hypothetical protein
VVTCTRKVLSARSFPIASTSKETQFFFPFSLRWRISDALPVLRLLKQPLAKPIRVFNNPMKIPPWTLPSEYRTQRVLFSLCLPAQCLNAHLAECLLSYAPHALAQCPLGKVSRVLSDSDFLRTHSRVLLQHPVPVLNAHLAELHRTPQRFCLQLCSSPQPSLQGIQQP